MQKRGFTLVEVLVYLGLTSVIVVTAVTMALQILRDQAAEEIRANIVAEHQYVMDTMDTFFSRASMLDGGSTLSMHPGDVTVLYASRMDAQIYVASEDVLLGGVTTTINRMMLRDGMNTPTPLTSEDVTVTNFVVEELIGAASSLRTSLTLEDARGVVDPIYDVSYSWNSSFSFYGR